MTDICERLVRFAGKVCISTDTEVEAAAIIEALRDENTRLKEAQKKLEEQFHKVACEEADAQKEIARLRHMLDAETDQARKDVVYFDELRAENERLQAKCEFIYDELLEAKGQVVKLRAAGEEVVKWWLSEGAKHFDGAPHAMFRLRAAMGESDG